MGAPHIDLDSIIPGDVVEHANSGRRGCVVEVGMASLDRTTEYRVRPAWSLSGPTRDADLIWWRSTQIRRVPARCPHRRYLAMVAVEDDFLSQERRQRPPDGRSSWACRRRAFGPWLPEAAWDKLRWRLINRMRIDPSGQYVHYSLGRDSWERAANDCLRRSDRAALWWMGQAR
jgi:hypothetical protein